MSIRELFDFITDITITDDSVHDYLDQVGGCGVCSLIDNVTDTTSYTNQGHTISR